MGDTRQLSYQQLLQDLQEAKFTLRRPSDKASDASEESLLVRTLVHRNELERALATVTEKLVQGLYFNELLDCIYETFRSLIPFDRISCGLLENDGISTIAHWVRTEAEEAHLKKGYRMRMSSSLQKLIDTGKPRIINDLEAYAHKHPQSESTRLILQEGIRSSLTCPLLVKGKPVGFVFFSCKEKNAYETVDQEILVRLANLISIALEKDNLCQELHNLYWELTEARDSLKVQTIHDPQTGLWNRDAILEILSKSFDFAKRKQAGLALVVVDIDHLTRVNDSYGHDAGDAVLHAVARRIETSLRTADYVGRYEGGGFLVILHDSDDTGASIVAERIRRVICASPLVLGHDSLSVTVSLGIASKPAQGSTISLKTLIGQANDALGAAKKQGRNLVMRYGQFAG